MTNPINKLPSFSYHREWLDNGIYVIMSGEISSKAILTANDPIVGDSRLDSLRFEIWDFTDVTSIQDKEQIASIIYYFDKETSAWAKGLKIAFIITCPQIEIIFEEYHVLMKDSYWETRTFSTLEEAKDWCNK